MMSAASGEVGSPAKRGGHLLTSGRGAARSSRSSRVLHFEARAWSSKARKRSATSFARSCVSPAVHSIASAASASPVRPDEAEPRAALLPIPSRTPRAGRVADLEVEEDEALRGRGHRRRFLLAVHDPHRPSGRKRGTCRRR